MDAGVRGNDSGCVALSASQGGETSWDSTARILTLRARRL